MVNEFALIVSQLQTDQKITAVFVLVVSIIRLKSQTETFAKPLVLFTGLDFTRYFSKAGRPGQKYLTAVLELLVQNQTRRTRSVTFA